MFKNVCHYHFGIDETVQFEDIMDFAPLFFGSGFWCLRTSWILSSEGNLILSPGSQRGSMLYWYSLKFLPSSLKICYAYIVFLFFIYITLPTFWILFISILFFLAHCFTCDASNFTFIQLIFFFFYLSPWVLLHVSVSQAHVQLFHPLSFL